MLHTQTTTQAPVGATVPGHGAKFVTKSTFLLVPAVVGVAAHLAFSWIGFAPTDEGWVLADSRRILAGQVPHRDFFKVQTAGTLFLHAPEVVFGGDYTFWISRLVAWLQIAVIAWAWPEIFSKLTKKKLSWGHRTVLGLICFAFTASTLPIMAWPTTDGLFFISVGLLLALRMGSLSKVCGYFLIGFSYVCKQNFVVVFPAALVLLGDWKKIRYWAAAATPGALYVAFLLSLGALHDAIIQIGSAGGFVDRAILPYLLSKKVLLATGVGFLSTALVYRKERQAAFLGQMMAYLVVLACAVTLSTELYWYSERSPFILFGFSLGTALALFFFKIGVGEGATSGFLAVIVAWAVSISNGFNYPTLAGGVLVLFLVQILLMDQGELFGNKNASVLTLAVLLVVSLVSFCAGRYRHIYEDLAANKLTAKLDGVLPGGRLIRTNPNTFAFLSDLNLAIAKTRGVRYAIIPGFPAYWVKGSQLDPLPIDWPYFEMLPNPSMIARLEKSIADQKGSIVLLVQKVEPKDLDHGFVPLNESVYPKAVLSYVKTHFVKVGETEYFELRQ